MQANTAKIIGIVGGVGPQAGVDLHQKLVVYTSELIHPRCDQEHLSVIHMALPSQIADRSAYLATPGNCLHPGFAIYEVIQRLYQNGARVIGIPCNTCHAKAIFSQIQGLVDTELGADIELLHMIREVCRKVRAMGFKRVGLLATMGTYSSQLYFDIFAEQGIEILQPQDEMSQQQVHNAIYDPDFGIKANADLTDNKFARRILLEEARKMQRRRAQAIIMGCTEIPLVLRAQDLALPLLDATAVLARALVHRAFGFNKQD